MLMEGTLDGEQRIAMMEAMADKNTEAWNKLTTEFKNNASGTEGRVEPTEKHYGGNNEDLTHRNV